MNSKISSRRITLTAVLASALGVVGYGALHAPASAHATPAAPHGAAVVRPAAVAGAWVYKDATTVETLNLKVDRKGAVSGHGASTVRSATDPRKSGQFIINVHDGRLRGNTLTLSLYVQEQFGTYYTAIENLRCATTTRVLRCRMGTQILNKVYSNIPQDFYRR